MKDIIVFVSNFKSHYLSLMKILEELKNRGYNIIFFIQNNPLLQKFLTDQGFSYFIVETNYNSTLNIQYSDLKNVQELNDKLKNSRNEFPYNLLVNNNKANDKNFDEIKNEYKDQTQILDAFNTLINDLNLFSKVKEYVTLLKDSYCYNHIHLIDETKITDYMQDSAQQIKIFNYILLFEILFPDFLKQPLCLKLFSKDYARFKRVIKLYENIWILKIYSESSWRFIERLFFYDEIFKRYNPKLIICEPFTSRYLVLAKELKIPVVFITNIFFDEKHLNMPPLSSRFVPKNNLLSKFYVNLLWWVRRIKIYCHYSNLLIYLITPPAVKEIIRKLNTINKKYANLIATGVYSYNHIDIPKLILHIKELEFSGLDELRDTVHYIGPHIYKQKSILTFNWQDVGEYEKLIYCSFGSVYLGKDNLVMDFYEKLFAFISQSVNYKLIISLGDKLPIEKLGNVPKNVHVYNWVSQFEILKKADLMIHNGGSGSLIECIYNNVPMLIYPLFGDQFGNSARILYHQLGLRGNIKKDTLRQLNDKINTLLTTPSFKLNIQKMHDKFIKYDDKNLGADFIESYISGN